MAQIKNIPRTAVVIRLFDDFLSFLVIYQGIKRLGLNQDMVRNSAHVFLMSQTGVFVSPGAPE